MIVAKLHFFQVKIELISAHAVVAFQLDLGIIPEVLNAVNVMALAQGITFLMIDAIVFEAIQHQSIIRAKAISVDDALWNDFGSDDLSQRLSRNVFDNASVKAAIASKQAKYGHFTGCTMTDRDGLYDDRRSKIRHTRLRHRRGFRIHTL